MKKIFTLCVVLCLSYLSMGATNLKHEFRATWLTTAWGNDWPKTKVTNATTRKQQQDSLIAIFDRLQAGNMNAVCFQVRGRSDAFYESSYEPWAAELAGARGKDPGYDPLAFAIEEAHKRGLELHAWVNPFRVTSAGTLDANDLVKENAGQWIIQYNNGSFTGEIIDPGYPEAREYVLNVLMEIISNYDIDGIVMDDYFYPYGGTTTEDAASKALHKPANVVDVNKDGKTDDDWRRSNVDVFLKELYDRIQAKKPWVRFGMGTFGIWTTQTKVAQAYGISLPSGISGLDDYDEQACNPVEWVQNGYVDYINPQLYWPTTSTGQNYNKLCQWWAKDVCEHFSNQLTNGKKVHFFSSQSISSNSAVSEIQAEIDANRSYLSSGSTGSVFFDTDAYLTMDNALMTSRFATHALTPPMDWKSKTALSAPTNLTISGTTLTWQHATAERFTVYVYPKGTAWSTANNDPSYLQGVIYGKSMDISGIDTNANDIAVCAYDRFGVEHTAAVYSNDSGAGTTPNPETIIWELNGGEVNTVTVEVPSLTTLEAQFKNDYNSYFGASVATTREITNFLYYGSKEEGGSNLVYNMMNDPAADWTWLRDYIISKSASNTTIQTALLDGTDAYWRYSIVAFLTASAGTNSTYTVDFSIAGQPSKWGTAYQIAHGAVLLPTYVTSAFTLPIPTHPEGHDFLGWYDNAEFIGSPLTTISADWTGTLYAQWQENAPTIDPTWQILYTSTDGNVVEPYKTNVFGANIVSNTYENGVGTITFDGPVMSIGDEAFNDCPSLTSITIPNSVTSIGDYAFLDCEGLTSVTIPNNVTNIGECAFRYCSNLTSVVWNAKKYSGYSSYDNNPFYDIRFQITSFNFGDSVEYIPADLCSNMSNLLSIIIPNSVTNIGEGAFWKCSGLTSVTIPNSVTTIENDAFSDCDGLATISIPNSITSVGDYAFANCDNLTSVVWNATSCDNFNKGFSGSKITSLTIGDSVQHIPEGLCYGMNNLTSVVWNAKSYDDFHNNEDAPFYGYLIESLTFGDNVEYIPAHFCTGMWNLISVTIGNSVTSIGNYAFYSCDSLTSINIPNSVKSIGECAFYDCSSLASVIIGNSVTNIGRWAFADCSSLASITIGNGVTSIGECAFARGYKLTTITIPNSVTSIGNYAFTNSSGLRSISIGNSVMSIGNQAFAGCSLLDTINIKAITPPTLGENVFYETSVSTCVIPCGTLSAYQSSDWASQVGAFEDPCYIDPTWQITYTSSNDSIVTPSATDVFGANIVSNTYENGVGTITFDGPVTSIGYEAFYQCESLASITIPNSVTSIGDRAFRDCFSLISITIPNSVTSIGGLAFIYCHSLTSITIPNSVTSIGESAFRYCTSLTSMTVENANTVYDSRENCNAIIETATNTLIAGCQNTIIPNSVTSIGDDAFFGCQSLTSITIPNSVTSIGSSAFWGCTSLDSVTIPNSVTSIGDEAFDSCDLITSITIPNSVTSIGDNAFGGCDLISINVESGNTIYDSRENCNAIIETASNTLIAGCQNTVIPNSVTNIGDYAFWGRTDLTSITIPNSVTSIGRSAFGSCSSLPSLTVPDGVTRIGACAFIYCRSLTSITIPNSVTNIGDYVFYYCYSLDTIHVKATTPPTLGDDLLKETPSPICVIPCGTLAAYEASDWANYMGEFVEVCPTVVKAKVPATWENDDITVWVWTDGAGTEYPTTKEGDWYVYTHTDDAEFNIIFKSGTGWKGNTYQTVDINGITENICLEIQPTNIKATYTIVDCPSIIYELNGGVTNDYDWMSKDDMYHELLVDINAIMPTTKVDVDTVTLAYDKTKNIQEGIPTYWGSLDSLFTNIDFLSKWSWLINYMDSTCVLESKSLPSTSSAYLRFNLSAFFIEKERTAWPTTPDYSKYGLYSYYQPAWQHGFANPTNPMGDFILNAPYREGYTFAGWYTTPDFSGDKVTTINAETEGTLYAKWIDETWVIKYTSTDGNIVTPYATDVFGANIVNNTYEDGVGTLTFDGAVTCIGDSAFYNCDGLVLITIPNNVTSIGNNAFYNCDGLISMTIPNSVTSVGDFAFFRCLGFSSITIPNGVTKIGSHAFRECSSLKSITIPSSVMEIGRGAFEGAFENYSGLLSIIVDSDNHIYDSRENCNAIIETATNTLVVGCQNTIIPNSVTIIGERAFRGSTFTSITIPSSVTSMEYLAFFECDSLDAIYMEAITPPTLGNQVFNGAASFSMHIPCGTLAAYEASDWAQYVSEFIEEGCISFELNGGVVSAELPIYIASSYTLPTPTREGYIFRGWYNNPQGIGNRLSTLPAGYEGTIYAYWTKEPTDALNPFAYALSSELSQDNSQLLINYSLNARAMDVQIVIMDGETAVKTIACDGISKGSHSIAIPTAGLPEHKQLTWKVEVKGAEVTEPTEYAVNYSFYHPSAVDIDNNPENPTFGMILTNEGMHSIKNQDADIFKDYLSYNMGAGIYAFNPAFEPMPNGDKPGYNGGIEFTEKRADAPDSITNGYTAYSPRRIRISEDGRIFVTSLNTDGNYLWEVNPENMNEWNSIFKGTLNGDKELVDAGGNFIAAPNCGFDVKGSGENLQLMMYSVNLPGITAAMSGSRCDEYNLGTATSWATAPSKNWVLGKYAINYTGIQVEYDNEGGIWIAFYRGAASDANPGLVHINKDGVEDAKLVWSMLRNAGIRFNHDFTKLVIAGVNGGSTSNPKKATIYAVSKDSNGAPVLTEEAVIDMTTIGSNLNDFAFDYAGNLYSCGNSSEKIVAWAMPRSADEVITTPAASKYNFTYSDDAITYELNGGVTNDYGWMSKDDMYHELLVDINAIIPTSRVDVDTVTLAYDKTKNISEGIPTYWLDESLNVLLTNSDFLSKWGWLIDYIEGACASESKWLPSTSARYLRFNLSAFFFEKEYTSWPQTPDYSKYGLYYNFQTAWKHAYTNPTNPTEEVTLNTPYKEGYTFAGWYTNADLSGEKITIVEAETNDTLYAKWIENSLVESTWKVLYTSTNGGIVAPNAIDVFGANIVSNTYENGVGTITFDGPVTSIGTAAFHDCLTLKSITIPNSVNSIGVQAFSDCSAIDSLTIPENVNSISGWAFIDCSSLLSIVVAQENMTYDSRENCNAIIETATNTLIVGCKKTIIPNGVVTIGEHAFRISSLAFITIPNSVTNIERLAFFGSSIDTIYVEATTPPALADSTVFMYTPSPICVIPCGTIAAYEASDWASQVGRFEEDCVEGQQIFYTSTDGNIVTPYNVNAFDANIVSNIYENGVGTITFDGPVTSIGENAFRQCSSIASITIPKSVKSIGEYAFSQCSYLSSITIPDSVTRIGDWAFSFCMTLTSVTIHDSVTSIGEGAFWHCNSLTSITIPSSVTNIGYGVFGYCYNLASLVIEEGNTIYDSRDNCNAIIETTTNTLISGCQNTIILNNVTSIGAEAFYGCSSLTSIILPNSVTNIGEQAFANCSGLTSITLPNSVMNIGDQAFVHCSRLDSITLPNSVTSIGEMAFLYCSSLDTIHVEATTPPALEDSTVFMNTPAPVCVIPCGTLAAYEASDWASQVGSFEEDCVEGQQIYYTSSNDSIVTPFATDVFGANIVSNTYENGVGTITFDGPVTSIGRYAFVNCSSLTSITVPNSVTSIGESAFDGCSSLTTVAVLNSNVESIGDRAFYNCSSLVSIAITNSVKKIGKWAFNGCKSLLSIVIGNGVTSIEEETFYGCESLKSVTIGNNVTTIKYLAFGVCDIDTITIPHSVKTIEDGAFYGCNSLTSIIVEGNNEYYDSRENCNAIIETISNNLIVGCQNTVIPNSVTSIGNYAFTCFIDTIHVDAVTPPALLSKNVFVTHPVCVIPCGTLADYEASDWASQVGSFVEDCVEGQQIYYTSTDGNIVTPNATDVFGANIVSNIYENGVGTITFDGPVTSIGEEAFYGCSGITSITIPNSVISIGSYAFYSCSFASITLPESVTNIGEGAFYMCDSLVTINIPDGITSIENRTFYSCESLASIKIPDNVVSIGEETFYNCKSLTSVNIPNNVTNIGDGAFDHCSTIDSIFVPKSVTQIGEWAFRDMRSLISIVVEDGNTTYDSRENCNAIIETASNTLIFGCKKTIIPNTIVQIGSHAFESSASGISLLVIPNSVQYIGEYAFNCLNMWKITVEAIHPPVLADNVFAPNHSNYLKCIIPCGTLDAYQSSAWASQVGSFVEECVEGQQITYTSTDGNIVTPNKTDVFGANIVSNTYENGVGTITFDAPVIRIGDAAFSSCESLTSITIPNSVTGIGNSAFSSCTSLTSITIPNSVTSIGTGVFSNCYFLASVIIPNSVTSIEAGVFYRCSSLTYVTIPNSVTSIGERAFAYCSSLDTIHVEAITPPTLESNVFIESPVSICYIPCGTLAAYESSDWASQVSEFVEACVEGQQIYYTSTDGNIITPYRIDDFGANIVSNTYENGVGIITFDAPVTSVAFSSCSTLTSIIIPNSVTSIGWSAFQNCSSLTSINIPSSIMSITQYALAGCSSLTSIVVESGNTSYDSRNNCDAIIETETNMLIAGCQNTIIPNSVTSIGTAAFKGCSGLTAITIPNSITTIGWGAFVDCSSLTSITLPHSITSVVNFAFSTCVSLDTIYVEATTPPTLGENVFALTPSPVCVIPCGTLAAYEASDWAQYVSEFVEEGCAPIQMCGDDLYWEYADGVLTITGTGDMYDYADDKTGPAPWYDVRGSITTINMPNEMTKIGDYAFYKCTEVTSINMPTSLTAIGEKAFAQDTKLACEIILPASMTTIASRAFFNCQAVTAFHIEATTPPTIPNDAFERTTAPIHVPCGYGHVYGKHAQWGVLNLEMCELLQDNVYYYPIDSHTARAVTYHSNPTDTLVIPSAVVIDGLPRTVTEVAASAFADCKDIPAIIFNEGLEYIGERAFVRCYGLQGTIVLPATLETIGERAFSYCDNVEKYLIQAMTPPALGDGAFTCANHDALFYVSCEVMDDYKVAARWSSLKSRLRDACLNIYHYNTALGANGVYTTEDTLVASIYYRRQFTPYRWETLYLPFEVDRVTVLEDGVEYDLTAWDIVDGGHYFLAKPDGMLNKEILFGFTDELESHTPYIIQFSDAYYTDKLITFYGKESWNKLSTSFEVLSSSSWMQIAGNTTLQDQLLEKPVYMLRSGLDFILQKTTTTLHPFECYVMPYATPSGTPARMNVRFRGDVPTAVESVKGNESHLTYTVDGCTLTVYPQGQAFSIYSLNGALIYSCEAGKEAVDCELNSGCYLLHAGTEAHKIML